MSNPRWLIATVCNSTTNLVRPPVWSNQHLSVKRQPSANRHNRDNCARAAIAEDFNSEGGRARFAGDLGLEIAGDSRFGRGACLASQAGILAAEFLHDGVIRYVGERAVVVEILHVAMSLEIKGVIERVVHSVELERADPGFIAQAAVERDGG